MRWRCLLWLLCLPVLPAFADDVLQTINELQTIEVVGTRAQTLPGKAEIISAADVEQVNAAHPAELLNRVAGVWVSRGGGQEHLTALRSPVWTGAGACGEVLYAEDGVPVRPSGFCNANQLMEMNTEQAGGVEVLRGAQGGSLYGANAVHGVINVLTLPVQQQDSTVRVEGGPNDYARLMWKQALDAGYVAFNNTHDGGYQDSSGFDQQKLSAKFQQQLSDVQLTHSFTATRLDQQSIGYLVGADAYQDDARKTENPNPDAYRDANAFRYVQSWDWSDDDYRYSIKPYLRHSDMDFTQHFNPGQPLEKNGHNSVGVQGLMQRDHFAWGAWHAGAEVETATAWTQEWQALPMVAGSPQGDHYDYRVAMHTAALWQEVVWHVSDRIDAQLGARADRIFYDYDNRIGDGVSGKYVRPADRGDGFTLLSPRLGMVYTDAADNEWYASLSAGKRAPQTAELYRLQNGQADIGAESMDAAEIGWRGKNQTGTDWAIALFDMRKDHVIVRNSANVLDDDARTVHRGVEFSVQQQWQSGWFVAIEAAYAEHRYNSDVVAGADGNIMDTAPRTLGAVQWGWQHAGLRAELEWQHMGKYYLDAENLFEYTGHDLLNLRVQQALDTRWTVFARLMNMTNEDYAERADVTVKPPVQPRYFVGLPRSIFLGIEWNY